MSYRKVCWIEQIWYVIRYKMRARAEWQEAKKWAAGCCPAWLELASKAKSEAVRREYREKILKAYRGCEYV